MLSEDDPLIYAGMQVEPGGTTSCFEGNGPCGISCIQSAAGNGSVGPDGQGRFVDEREGIPAESISLKDKASVLNKGSRRWPSIVAPQLADGGYGLVIDICDGSSAECARLHTDVEIAETVTGGRPGSGSN